MNIHGKTGFFADTFEFFILTLSFHMIVKDISLLVERTSTFNQVRW